MWRQLPKNIVLDKLILLRSFVAILSFTIIFTSCMQSPASTDENPQILNFNGKNDLAFLLNMNYEVAKSFWDSDSIEITEHLTEGFAKFTVTLSPGVYLDVGHDDKIRCVMVVYTKTSKPDSASLLGLNGYDTIKSIADKFGRENVYPYNEAVSHGGEIIQDVNSDMCSIILYDHYFYRANFDENGVMLDAFIGGGI